MGVNVGIELKKRHKNAKASLLKPGFSVLNQIDQLSVPGQDWVSRLDGDISVGAGITIIPVSMPSIESLSIETGTWAATNPSHIVPKCSARSSARKQGTLETHICASHWLFIINISECPMIEINLFSNVLISTSSNTVFSKPFPRFQLTVKLHNCIWTRVFHQWLYCLSF